MWMSHQSITNVSLLAGRPYPVVMLAKANVTSALPGLHPIPSRVIILFANSPVADNTRHAPTHVPPIAMETIHAHHVRRLAMCNVPIQNARYDATNLAYPVPRNGVLQLVPILRAQCHVPLPATISHAQLAVARFSRVGTSVRLYVARNVLLSSTVRFVEAMKC